MVSYNNRHLRGEVLLYRYITYLAATAHLIAPSGVNFSEL